MNVFDVIKNMSVEELAFFISDLVCGNSSDLVDSFGECLCSDCKGAGLELEGRTVRTCDFSCGNCNDVRRVAAWLESEVGEDD